MASSSVSTDTHSVVQVMTATSKRFMVETSPCGIFLYRSNLLHEGARRSATNTTPLMNVVIVVLVFGFFVKAFSQRYDEHDETRRNTTKHDETRGYLGADNLRGRCDSSCRRDRSKANAL
jgi:hypothetical protein